MSLLCDGEAVLPSCGEVLKLMRREEMRYCPVLMVLLPSQVLVAAIGLHIFLPPTGEANSRTVLEAQQEKVLVN